MKIIFAGTPDFAVYPLKALQQEHDIVAVFTQPDRKAGRGKKLTPPPVKVAALALDIPVFQPDTLKDQQELIASFDADIMVVVAYGMLLPQDILDTPKLGCLNIHASILPRWDQSIKCLKPPFQQVIRHQACTTHWPNWALKGLSKRLRYLKKSQTQFRQSRMMNKPITQKRSPSKKRLSIGIMMPHRSINKFAPSPLGRFAKPRTTGFAFVCGGQH